MKLSKREIILLLVLAFALLAFGGVRQILLPFYHTYQDNQVQLASLHDQYNTMSSQIAQSKDIETQLSAAQLQAAQLASEYEALMPNYDADRYLYDLMETHRLKAYELEIQDPAPQPESPYVPGQIPVTDETSEETNIMPINGTVLEVELEGRWKDIEGFLSTVDTYPSKIRITTVDIEDKGIYPYNGNIVRGKVGMLIYYAQ